MTFNIPAYVIEMLSHQIVWISQDLAVKLTQFKIPFYILQPLKAFAMLTAIQFYHDLRI